MSEVPPAAEAPEIEGSMFMFRKPELLTKDKFDGKGVKHPERAFAFCESVRAVPITVAEMAAVQRNYPIIFSDTENPMPLAVVGIIDDVNLYVDDQGNWDPSAYIPGYIRRYPFALANDKNNDRMAMVIDSEYEGISSDYEDGLAFFDGEDVSDATKGAMEFCRSYEQDRLMTKHFSEALGKFNVLTGQAAQFTPEGNGEPQAFAQYVGVEEKLLNELDDEKFKELRSTNILPLLYAQLMSMGNWRTLIDRRAARFNLSAEKFLDPVTKQ